jgi:hypothetical protein
MKKAIHFFIFFLLLSLTSTLLNAQVDAFTIVGKKKNEVDNRYGFGGFLKLSDPVANDADEVTAELALLGLDGYSVGFIPMKAGYRYTVNRTGYGIYVEPQTGYAIGGDYDEKANGFIGSANVGYLFQPWGGVRFDVALRFENIFTSIGTYSFVGLRLAHNISLRRRDDY